MIQMVACRRVDNTPIPLAAANESIYFFAEKLHSQKVSCNKQTHLVAGRAGCE